MPYVLNAGKVLFERNSVFEFYVRISFRTFRKHCGNKVNVSIEQT